MQLLTIARRATLGPTIVRRHDLVVEELDAARGLLSTVLAVDDLPPVQERLARSNYLVGLVSLVEAYAADMAVEILVAYPGKLPDKAIDVRSLSRSGSIVDAIQIAAQAHVQRVTRKSAGEWLGELLGLFDPDVAFEPEAVRPASEIALTRNLLVHNGGVVNSTYLANAGRLSRAEEGKLIPLDDAYLLASRDSLVALLDTFHRLGPSRFENHDRVRAFKGMWEATALQNLVAFDVAWEEAPTRKLYQRDIQWDWSTSEKMLYDFFLTIFNPRHPDLEYSVVDALRRWPAPYREGRIIRSWLDSPFWL